MRQNTPAIWRNALLFKAGWLGIVLINQEVIFVVAAVTVLAVSRLTASQRLCWLLLVMLGSVMDSLLIASQIFVAHGALSPGGWLPWWLFVLWGWFAWFWISTLQPLLPSNLAILIVGMLGGPLAYQAGSALNPQLLTIIENVWFWPLLAVGWALCLLFWQAMWERLHGVR